MLRVLTSKDKELSHFDKINGAQAEIKITSLKSMVINDHEEANRGEVKDQLPLELTFSFCSRF